MRAPHVQLMFVHQVNFVLLVRGPCTIKTSKPKMEWLVEAKTIAERCLADCNMLPCLACVLARDDTVVVWCCRRAAASRPVWSHPAYDQRGAL